MRSAAELAGNLRKIPLVTIKVRRVTISANKVRRKRVKYLLYRRCNVD
jgi:hypothetical protein